MERLLLLDLINLANLVKVTTVLANLAAFLGIPMAIIVLILDRRRARQDREQLTYQTLQSQYSDFLKLCLNNPDLQLHDYHPGKKAVQNPKQDKHMVALEILVSMFESAFFLYHHGHHSEFKRRQWKGWEDFMRDWVSRDDFRSAWEEHLGSQFDSEFISYVDRLVDEYENPK